MSWVPRLRDEAIPIAAPILSLRRQGDVKADDAREIHFCSKAFHDQVSNIGRCRVEEVPDLAPFSRPWGNAGCLHK